MPGAHRRNRRAVADAAATRSSEAAATEGQVPAVADAHRRSQRAVEDAAVTRSSAEAAVIEGQVPAEADAHRRNRRAVEGAVATRSSEEAAEGADATHLVVTDLVGVKQRRTVHAVRRAAVRCPVAVVADAARALALLAAAAEG